MSSSPYLSFFFMQTVTLGPVLQVCMGPRPHLWFWAHITACLAQESKDSIGSSPHLSIRACKTATLGLEFQVSVGRRPHLFFLHAKLRLLDQNNKSLWIQDMTVVLCACNSVLNIRNTSLYGSQPSSVVFACNPAWLTPEKLVSMGPSPYLWFLGPFWSRIASLYGSLTLSIVLCMQNSVISIGNTSL